MPQCSNCSRMFRDEQDLHAHCRDKADHPYCESCERLFVHFEALNMHMQHSSLHCDDSDDGYFSETTVDDDLFCDACNRSFVSTKGLYQHLASLRHNWCFVCSRDFSSPRALEQHSRVHLPRDLLCPLCHNAFKTPSAIALHVESGYCHNITRHQVTAAVHSLPVVPTISIARRIQGSGSAGDRIVQYRASERAFNGSAYECYLCHRTFRTLVSLNKHLGSPFHDKDEFKCPNCRRTYKLISGLMQHIESEVCGAAKFEQVQDFARDLTDRFSRLLQ